MFKQTSLGIKKAIFDLGIDVRQNLSFVKYWTSFDKNQAFRKNLNFKTRKFNPKIINFGMKLYDDSKACH